MVVPLATSAGVNHKVVPLAISAGVDHALRWPKCPAEQDTDTPAAAWPQGITVGCKPLVAVMRYMQDTSTSIEQMEAMLKPLLAAKQHLPKPQPVPTARMTPAERTAALSRQQQQQQQQSPAHSSSSSQAAYHQQGDVERKQLQQHSRPCLSHLLDNVRAVLGTIAVTKQQQGFKQVAWGPLQLWYFHDTAASRQLLRAKVVLEEPLSVSRHGFGCDCAKPCRQARVRT